MLTAPPPQYRPLSTTTLIAWCAAASLGLLFLKTNQLAYASTSQGALYSGTSTIIPLAITVGGLVAWHLAPRRAWAWLLLAGGVCAVPGALFGVLPDLYDPSMYYVLMVAWASGPALTLTGLLGAATVMWQAGTRTVGAALVGTALVIQVVGPVVIVAAQLDRMAPMMWSAMTMVFVLMAIVAAAIALVAARSAEPPRPRWRVTVAGGVAAMTQLLPLLWPAVTSDSRRTYLLLIGLVLLAVGLVIAASAGRTVVLGAVSAGLMLGAFGMLIAPSVEVLHEIPVVAAVAALGSTAAGFAVALHRRRTEIAVGGLLVVFVGLLVIFGLFNSDLAFSSYEGFTFAATPVLLVIGVVAGVCAIASIGDALAEQSATPAVLVGVAAPMTLGTIAVIGHFMANPPANKAPLTALLTPTAGALLLAALALAALRRFPSTA